MAVGGRAESRNIINQDQELQTNIMQLRVQTEADNKCRFCQKFDETINHTIAACQVLVTERCINRHDTVCAELQGNGGKS